MLVAWLSLHAVDDFTLKGGISSPQYNLQLFQKLLPVVVSLLPVLLLADFVLVSQCDFLTRFANLPLGIQFSF